MAKKTRSPEPHPDDFMLVTVSLEFQAKLNPEVGDPPPLDATSATEYTLRAEEAADYLEEVVRAIRERRLTASWCKKAPKMPLELASESKKQRKK
jgi:hypothetical protein